MCNFLINPHKQLHPEWIEKGYGAFGDSGILEFHKSLPDYAPTPVIELKGLAKNLGLKNIYVKDEGLRFGIKSFKPLGASYSVFCFLKQQLQNRFAEELKPCDFLSPEVMQKLGQYTFCAATDGNHGRAVAWTAHKLNQRAVIYMPSNTAHSRIENIKSEGAEVVLVDGNFNQCVALCQKDAIENNWQVIADTAYSGYMELPYFIMAGYTTIFVEMQGIVNFIDHTKADVVIIQAGVGGLAAAGSWYYRSHYPAKGPKLVCMEPNFADSFMESAKHGQVRESKQNYQSIMAGLNCGVSLVAFPIIKDAIDVFVTTSDYYAEQAIKKYYTTVHNDRQIISGESGASGLAGLLALLSETKLADAKEYLKLDNSCSVLLINTESDTDPENFRRIISQHK